MSQLRVPPDDVAAAAVRSRECHVEQTLKSADDPPSPEKLSRPQKRRRRMQVLAAHRALEKARQNIDCSYDADGKTNAKPLLPDETSLMRLEYKLDSMLNSVCCLLNIPGLGCPDWFDTDRQSRVSEEADLQCMRPDAPPTQKDSTTSSM